MNRTKDFSELAWEKNLIIFARVLRSLGIKVSFSEIVDALRALDMIPLTDKKAVKTALCATLVKEPENMPIFDSAFETFFAVPEKKQMLDARRAETIEAEAKALDKAGEELVFQGESLKLSNDDKLFYAHLNESQQQRMQDFLQKTSDGKNVGENFQSVVESLVKGHLNYWKRNIKSPRKHLPPINKTGDEEIDNLTKDVQTDLSRDEMSVLFQDMQQIKDSDFPKVAKAIKRLSRRLATRLSRRYHRTRRKDRIDIRRSIRENIRYGGTMLTLKYSGRKVQKPSLLLICDVSGSMARYAAFVLQFVYGIAHAAKKIESFIFSEDLERVTPFFKTRKSFEETMAEIMNQSNVWGEGTDLNRSLDRIMKDYPKLFTGNTIVIILSDTKTLQADSAAAKLEQLGKKTKEIIWLNSLPAEEWEEHRTVKIFQKHSQMYCCNTLADLENILHAKLL